MGKPSTAARIEVQRRRYESPLRRAHAAETRDRILAAGSALAHEARAWDWRDLTVRAIAGRAGVSERTVYRHFPSERQLHEAVMRRLEEEAGFSYEEIELDDLAAVTARLFATLPSFAVPPAAPRDETFVASDRRRRESLLRALGALTVAWTDAERQAAAAMLDVLWTPMSYERLVTGWGFDTARATAAVTWVIEVLIQAIRENRRPKPGAPLSSRLLSRK